MDDREEAEIEQREAAYDAALEKAAKAATLIAVLMIGLTLAVTVFDLPAWGIYIAGTMAVLASGAIIWRYRPVAHNRAHRVAIAKRALTGVAVIGGWTIAHLFITRLEMPVWGRIGIGVVYMAGYMAYVVAVSIRR